MQKVESETIKDKSLLIGKCQKTNYFSWIIQNSNPISQVIDCSTSKGHIAYVNEKELILIVINIPRKNVFNSFIEKLVSPT